jgi:ABC-2 type transport system ATP-binding protein
VISAREPASKVSATDVPAIETLSLVKHYGSVIALDGLSMSVPRGEIFGFLGPNGAGKTTVVKILVGLTRPSAGEGAVLGASFGDLEARRHIGYLPELFRYQEWLTAREVLLLHCTLAGIARPLRREESERALTTVGLAARGNDRVSGFSKGMQQRLGLGVALLGKPELVILDEPTSALDPVGRHDVREIIVALKRRGATVFLNSHLLTEVEKVCDRAAIVDRGRIVALGTLDELLGGNVLRLRLAAPISAEADSVLRRYGGVAASDGWMTLRGVATEQIPDLVEQLVHAGARLQAIEPSRSTLEERFLEVLEEEA